MGVVWSSAVEATQLSSEDIFFNLPPEARARSLEQACFKGDLKKVMRLSELLPEIHLMTIGSSSLLHYCARHGWNELCEKLIAAGSNLESKNIHLSTPIVVACQWKHLTIALMLQRAGADCSCQNEFGSTPLLHCCSYNNANADNDISESEKDANSVLIKYLIENKVTLNVPNISGDTPLMLASRWCDESVVQSLMVAGAVLNAKNKLGYSSLMYACEQGQLSCVKYLAEQGGDVEEAGNLDVYPFQLAWRFRHYEVMALLLQLGASPREPRSDYLQTRPLIFRLAGDGIWGASEVKERAAAMVLGILIDKGKPNEINAAWGPNRETALHMACDRYNRDCMRVLLEKGADGNAVDRRNSPPWHSCLSLDTLSLYTSLFPNIDVTVTDIVGRSYLHRLIHRLHTDKHDLASCVDILLAMSPGNVDLLNQQDVDGFTPLHRCCDKYRMNVFEVEVLLERGAYVTLHNKVSLEYYYHCIFYCDLLVGLSGWSIACGVDS